MYTIEEALAEGAHSVHEQYPDNIFTDSQFHIRKGDPAKAFEKADIIVEREYRTQYIEHSDIEPGGMCPLHQPQRWTDDRSFRFPEPILHQKICG